MSYILAPVEKEVALAQPSIEIEVDSLDLVPSVEDTPNGRELFLEYGGVKYPCLEKGWKSWAAKVFLPHDRAGLKEDEDETTPGNGRWSTATVRKLLDETSIETVNMLVYEWWKNYEHTTWHLIKYIDNGIQPGAIRYVGTNRYRLYKNEDILEDLKHADLDRFKLQHSNVHENNMMIRIVDKAPLEIPHTDRNLYSGIHIHNSENGSSSISMQHFIYDLVCTNGMMIVFGRHNFVQQRHTGFKPEVLRGRMQNVAGGLREFSEKSVEQISYAIERRVGKEEREDVLDFYKDKYNANSSFMGAVDESVGKFEPMLEGNDSIKLWDITSAITNVSQKFSLEARLRHESNAGKLIGDVKLGRHERKKDVGRN